MRNLFGILIALISLFITSCNRDEGLPSNNTTNNIEELDDYKIYELAKEDLNGWDKGFLYLSSKNENNYNILTSVDSIEGCRYIEFCNATSSNLSKSICFKTDLDNNLTDVYIEDKIFEVYDYDNTTSYLVLDTLGKIVGSFTVDKIPDNEGARFMSQNYSALNVFGNKINIGGFFSGAKDFVGIVSNLSEGKYGEIIYDALMGTLVGSLIKSEKIAIGTVLALKTFIKNHAERFKNIVMGNATIDIVSVKRNNGSVIQVICKLSNTSSIPTTIPIVQENGAIMYAPNEDIYFGVVQGKNTSVGYHLNNRCSNLRIINYPDQTFEFNIPVNYGSTYYFRPFLIPDYSVGSYNPHTNIRYGEAKKFVDFDVNINDVKKISSQKINDFYNVTLQITGTIPSLIDDLSNWGFCLLDKSGSNITQLFASETSGNVPTNKSFICNLQIASNEVSNNKYTLSIKPFWTYWNHLPATEYSEIIDYEIDVAPALCPDSNHPHAIDLGLPSGTKWCCMNVGATSPEGYGGYYAWGETSKKSVYNDVTYKYCSGKDTDGDGYYDENATWQNIGSDIAGTSYDAAHVNMGGSWVMPSITQQKEMSTYCSREWTQQNGVNGTLVTGPNGGKIFLPANGHRWNAYLRKAGSYGDYWSSSLGQNNEYGAYDFGFNSGSWLWGHGRSYGLAVRAVCP